MLELITCDESWISSYDEKRFQYTVSEHKDSTTGRRATMFQIHKGKASQKKNIVAHPIVRWQQQQVHTNTIFTHKPYWPSMA